LFCLCASKEDDNKPSSSSSSSFFVLFLCTYNRQWWARFVFSLSLFSLYVDSTKNDDEPVIFSYFVATLERF
jgi:hypothetical protein